MFYIMLKPFMASYGTVGRSITSSALVLIMPGIPLKGAHIQIHLLLPAGPVALWDL